MVAITSNRCRAGNSPPIGQTIAVLARLKTTTERLEKQVEKQGEMFVHALERLENRISHC